ncbi:DEAD/DEAH box helicase [Limosilactobacillus sp. STM2_1]|uniref:DEAD/DEAH box helicase n=1 Tax=Limosilactobacillus rudii TaxID=2759755 RepID=A0A7W3UMG6_9LACO|nr:DEAD/DEAH box helicase [Limosilactobacillus rudii]MBB1079775.1 DEAD/DEAH box helicase [Limosilactobacillus rudii]MBB1097765.1 DEAD/DEAH box helicase [Limosilactobacillus rudii]MCD7134846.1 DEAD/DEAH box helicase [Limosilactobacillus rudii]
MIEQFQKHFDEKYKQPTAIQTAVAPALQTDQSVLGIAPTGSGKTLAFTLPLLPKIMPGEGTQLLVLAPSQELAIQTTRVIREWATLIGVSVQSLTGGANLRRQVIKLHQHPDVVVGTPGRVLHMLDNHHLKLGHLMTMVVDEADDMLQDDTLAVVEDIERATPLSAQLAFFSATKSPVLDQLNVMFGRDIEVIDVRDQDNSRGPVEHGYLSARTNAQKTATLRRLTSIKDFRALVFFNSTRTLNYAASRLRHEHIAVATLGGRQKQTQREKAMRMFRKRQIKLLLTTDLAARGIDIPKLPAVINFDLPTSLNTYIHRVGRTGRQGEPGLALSLGDDHDIRDLKKLLHDTDYELKKLYVGDNQLANKKPEAGKQVISISKQASRHLQKEQLTGEPRLQKKIDKTLSGFSKPKKRRKKKNRKNKGIRLKHRRQNGEN